MENAISFQIVSQSSKITNYVKDMHVFTARNGWKIRVDQEPEIDINNKTIYLQGDDNSKNQRVYNDWSFSSNRKRDQIINEVHDALADLVSTYKSSEKPTWNPFKCGNHESDVYVILID